MQTSSLGLVPRGPCHPQLPEAQVSPSLLTCLLASSLTPESKEEEEDKEHQGGGH